MTETFFGVLAMILCVIGSVAIIRWFVLRLAVSGCKNRVYAVILKNQPDIELQMLIETIQWDDTLKDAKVYAVDGGMTDEMSKYCRAVCKGSNVKFVPFCEAEHLLQLF